MAARTAHEPDLTSPALLAKMAQASPVTWYTTSADDRSPADVVLPALAADLVTVAEQGTDAWVEVTLTDAGRTHAATATPEGLCTPVTDGESRAKAALWLWLLLHGEQDTGYGDKYPWGRSGDIAHLLTCGVDLATSSPVRDDTWTEWAGSFTGAVGDRETGVTGTATCRCGQVQRLAVQATVPSVTDLVRSILGL